MNSLNYKFSTWVIVLAIFGTLLFIIPSLDYTNGLHVDYGNLVSQLGLGILIGLIPSVMIGFIFFKEQFEKQLQVLGVSKEIINAGVTEYYDKWDEQILKDRLKDSKEVEIYMTYGATVIKNLSREILRRLEEKDFNVKFYIMHEDNPFVESLGSFWSKDNSDYDSEGIKSRIKESVNELSTIKSNSESDNMLNGKIEVFKLKYHPIFFSFYRFDDEVVFVPTKNVERKAYQVPSFVCKKLSDKGLYNWCVNQIEFIRDQSNNNSLEKIF